MGQIKYLSLGTFEFLVNPSTEEFYFLEINPRLQVEHTITEQICDIDLVKTQLRIAQGLPANLSHLSQDPLTPPAQHSIQLRLTAEDPSKNYSLSIGKIQSFQFPSGMGVRVDTALIQGVPAVVTSDFDSVIAKIIVTAQTWEDTVAKAGRALEDTTVVGIQTNLTLLRAIVSHPDFAAGECDTQWLESKHEELLGLSRQFEQTSDPMHGLGQAQSSSSTTSAVSSGAAVGGATFFRKDDAWNLSLLPQGSKTPQSHHLQLTRVLKNDFPTSFNASILYTLPGQKPAPYTLSLTSTSTSASAMSSAHPQGNKSNPDHVILPLSGKLVEVLVDVGDVVKQDEAICVIKQMKMEVEVRSHKSGRVSWVTEAEDDEDVAEGMLAAVVEDEKAKL